MKHVTEGCQIIHQCRAYWQSQIDDNASIKYFDKVAVPNEEHRVFHQQEDVECQASVYLIIQFI